MSQKPRRRAEPPPAPPARPTLRIAVTEGEIDDGGVSIEELGEAFAAMMQRDDPYQAAPEPAMDDAPPAVARPEPVDLATGSPETDDQAAPVSPRTILESMVFVGHPQNVPLTAATIAGLMRGVTPDEIDELVRELNEEYEADGAPYRIDSVDAGYQLRLRDEFAPLFDKLMGRTRETRLSQGAIDILAIVAYQQPIGRDRIDKLRGRASAAVLSQLVRRDLLRIERPQEKPRTPLYYTTERFLTLFGLGSLDDLPRSVDAEREL